MTPALKAAGREVEYLGEVTQSERDHVFAESFATIMPGAWPEPFGLVAIESLACGTPVIARRIGALPEIIRDGIDGFFGDDVTAMAFRVDRVEELDRAAIRSSVMERFSVERMTDGYEAVYARLVQPQHVESDSNLGDDPDVIPASRLSTRRTEQRQAIARKR